MAGMDEQAPKLAPKRRGSASLGGRSPELRLGIGIVAWTAFAVGESAMQEEPRSALDFTIVIRP